MILLWFGCSQGTPDDSGTSPLVEVLDTEQVAPGPGMPAEVVDQPSHNNLDVVLHAGRIFLAFRTAPSHFASSDTVIYVVSSADGETWDFETAFHLGTDLREPRFLEWDAHLYFYFAVLGSDPSDFEPQGIEMSAYQGPGSWTAPVSSYLPGFIGWRARTVNDVPQMIGYIGGENIYDDNGKPITIHLLTTPDGANWSGLVPQQPIVESGGGSETDYVYEDDGSLLAVTRNEAGDETGWGSKICTAPASDLGTWDCVGDPRKYDSPLMFRWGSQNWLVGRRSLANDGLYDLGDDAKSASAQSTEYELAWWTTPKRCSLWTVDAASRTVTWVADLPSKGDTCFPSILPIDDHEAWIYDYSSPIDGDDVPWNVGQSGDTYLYRTRVRFP